MSIFVINSTYGNKLNLAEILKNSGYSEIVAVNSTQEAYACLGISKEQNHIQVTGIDLILLDIQSLTETLDIIRSIKDSFQYQDTPLIVISENSSTEFLQMVFALGAVDLLKKPVAEEELVARVRASLRLKHEIDRRKAREKELMEATKQLSELNSWLTRLSLIDSLTKVANRRGFDHSFDQEWHRAIRNSSFISIIMIDVDYFKKFNDTYGHRAGDECLQKVAKAIKDSLKRPGDVVCRYGGEEFAVILADTNGPGAEHVAEGIRKSVVELQIPHGSSAVAKHVTISLGITAVVPTQSIKPEDVISRADKALYEAKEKGRNQLVRLEFSKNKKPPSKAS